MRRPLPDFSASLPSGLRMRMPKSAPAQAGTLRRMPSEPTPQLRSQMRAICGTVRDRKSTRLNSSHSQISYAVFCLKKKKHLIIYAVGFCCLPDVIEELRVPCHTLLLWRFFSSILSSQARIRIQLNCNISPLLECL